jgi:hypothetical protein
LTLCIYKKGDIYGNVIGIISGNVEGIIRGQKIGIVRGRVGIRPYPQNSSSKDNQTFLKNGLNFLRFISPLSRQNAF